MTANAQTVARSDLGSCSNEERIGSSFERISYEGRATLPNVKGKPEKSDVGRDSSADEWVENRLEQKQIREVIPAAVIRLDTVSGPVKQAQTETQTERQQNGPNQKDLDEDLLQMLLQKIIDLEQRQSMQQESDRLQKACYLDMRDTALTQSDLKALANIKICIAGVVYPAMLDTGANTGIFPQHIFEEIAPEAGYSIPPNQNVGVQVVGSEITKAKGKIKIPFTIPGHKHVFKYSFVVMKNTDFIVGIDF